MLFIAKTLFECLPFVIKSCQAAAPPLTAYESRQLAAFNSETFPISDRRNVIPKCHSMWEPVAAPTAAWRLMSHRKMLPSSGEYFQRDFTDCKQNLLAEQQLFPLRYWAKNNVSELAKIFESCRKYKKIYSFY